MGKLLSSQCNRVAITIAIGSADSIKMALNHGLIATLNKNLCQLRFLATKFGDSTTPEKSGKVRRSPTAIVESYYLWESELYHGRQ